LLSALLQCVIVSLPFVSVDDEPTSRSSKRHLCGSTPSPSSSSSSASLFISFFVWIADNHCRPRALADWTTSSALVNMAGFEAQMDAIQRAAAEVTGKISTAETELVTLKQALVDADAAVKADPDSEEEKATRNFLQGQVAALAQQKAALEDQKGALAQRKVALAQQNGALEQRKAELEKQKTLLLEREGGLCDYLFSGIWVCPPV